MKTFAYAAPSAKAPLAPFTFERRSPEAGDVAIDIQFCGICHSDIHTVRDEWGEKQYPLVPGHEIVGVVTKVGSGVTKHKVGDIVGVGCMVDSCRQCASCEEGLEQYCATGMVGTYGSKLADGSITQGGYSSHIVVNENYVLKMPAHLPLDAAAPLLCAGITLYSPLTHWKVGPGKKVAIIGLGGLGHMGVKIAHAMGAEVTILSHSLKKKEEGLKMGAKAFYATSDEKTFRTLRGEFDLIINTVSAEIDWNQYLALLKRDGTMVVLGLPEKAIPVNAFSLIMGRRRLAGSVIGGIKETQEMLDFCGKHNITCDIELIPAQKINEAYERVIKSDVRYRFVIDMKTIQY
jgi:alcohol dehydrogenase (NADP+)